MVQLKVNEAQLLANQSMAFQFLMVQLKVCISQTCCIVGVVSIPYGSIKSGII